LFGTALPAPAAVLKYSSGPTTVLRKSTNGFKKTFDLGVAESQAWSTVPAGPDGFFFIMGVTLREFNQRPFSTKSIAAARRFHISPAHQHQWPSSRRNGRPGLALSDAEIEGFFEAIGGFLKTVVGPDEYFSTAAGAGSAVPNKFPIRPVDHEWVRWRIDVTVLGGAKGFVGNSSEPC